MKKVERETDSIARTNISDVNHCKCMTEATYCEHTVAQGAQIKIVQSDKIRRESIISVYFRNYTYTLPSLFVTKVIKTTHRK